MEPLANLFLRVTSALEDRVQQVFTGTYEQPVGGKLGRVLIGRCTQAVDAARFSNHNKGDGVMVVGSNAGTHQTGYAILPAPPGNPGPASVATLKISGQSFAAPEDEILNLRFLVPVSPPSATSVVHPGLLNLTQGTFSIDTGTTLDSITWGTLQPDPGRFRKYWILPSGGEDVGANSICASVSLGDGATPIGDDGRTAIQLYNTTTSTVTEHLSTAVGDRFMQPVPDDDFWWFVEWSNDELHRATLFKIALDLTGGPILVNQTGLFTFPQLAAFSLTPTLGISAVFNGFSTAPVSCFRFQRDGSGTASITGFTPVGNPSGSDVHAVQSGRPDGILDSWGPKIISFSLSTFSHMSDTTGPVVETSIPLSEFMGGSLSSADIPGNTADVIAVVQLVSGTSTRIIRKATGEAGEMFSGPNIFGLEAVWVEG